MKKLPNHIGIIPDGNRRYAQSQNLEKEHGYNYGLEPGLSLLRDASKLGIKELTFYGYTTDNLKRPAKQVMAFKKACVDAVRLISSEAASLLIVGNTNTKNFPTELLPYTKPTIFNNGTIKVNFLVNYGFDWDIFSSDNPSINNLKSSGISRIDLIIRWGGMRRLSGFLPIQSVYSDFYVIDDLWPQYNKSHLDNAINWYLKTDDTLGG